MKLLIHRPLAFCLLLTGLLLSGCSTGTDWLFDGSSKAPSPAAPTTISKQAPAQVAHFHVGETVNVSFSGTQDQIPPHEESIKEDGTITLPLIGSVVAVGQSAGELQNEIHNLYVPQYYTRLTVTVKPGDLVYYVRGEVRQPNRQIYVGEITVTKAIASAGDFTDFANHNNVLLIRANGQTIRVDCDAAQQDPSKDPRVYPGDQIVVPRRLF